MSDIVLAKDGVYPEVIEPAEAIKAAQGPEIEQLQGLAERLGRRFRGAPDGRDGSRRRHDDRG
jgi:uncharacterized protein (DUF305 family)